MKRSLVVVESPTKVKTIQKYLDATYVVKASMGHVRDLPKSQLGVDPKKGFKPRYVISPSKKKVLDELKKAAEKSEALYVATDPDREGEAIGWHLAQELPVNKRKVYRITFNEITERAVKAAFLHPGKIDLKKVDAQQARRVLDRLVGYNLSPLLWDKVQRGLSAGRVQSVAVRLIVDREREIEAFRPVEYWSLHARLQGERPPEFTATLREVDGEKASLPDEATTRGVMERLEGARYVVRAVTRGERRRAPAPPFITSTLQQEAGRKLGFTAKKTMTLAQQLYEGIDLGGEGPVGLITYMRTDSVQIAREAQEEARALIGKRFGREYLPETPPGLPLARPRPGSARGHPALRGRPRSARPGAAPHQGSARPLSPHLGALRGQPDAARRLRHRGRGHRGGTGGRAGRGERGRSGDRPVPRPGTDPQVQGLHRGLRGEPRGERGGPRGRGGERHSPARGRRGAGPAGPRSQAALHPAAAALHGGLAGEGAGGAGDRPPVHLRVDPRHHHQRARLRAARAPHPLPDAARPRGDRSPEAVLSGDHGRRVHRADGGLARQDRGRGPPLGRHGEGVLRALRARHAPRREGDAQRQGGDGDGGSLPGVRSTAPRALGPLRQVPGLLGLPRLPLHPRSQRQRARRRRAHRRDVPDLRQAHGHQARALRQVHRVLGLPGVQDHQAGHPGHRVRGAGMRGPARGPAQPARPRLLRLLRLSHLHLRGLAAPGARRPARSARRRS